MFYRDDEGLEHSGRQVRVITCNHLQPRATTCNQVQSSAIECNQVQSSAIQCTHRDGEGLEPNRRQVWASGDKGEELSPSRLVHLHEL